MAGSTLDVASMVANLIGGGGKPAPVNETPKTMVLSDEDRKFGNWTGQASTKVMAQDLMKRGLKGADQLLFDNVDTSSGDTIRNAQSDWKVSAISNILSNIKKLGLRDKQAILANKDVLIGNSKWAEGINSPTFKKVHPNYWDVIIDSILPEQYKKFETK